MESEKVDVCKDCKSYKQPRCVLTEKFVARKLKACEKFILKSKLREKNNEEK